MYSKIKNSLIIYSVLISFKTLASGFYLPDANLPNGYDQVRTFNGTTCQSSIAPDSYLETGMYGNQTDNDNWQNNYKGYYNKARDELGVYARVVIPITGPKARLNCKRLYDLEVKRLELELKKLKKELEIQDLESIIFSEETESLKPVKEDLAPAPYALAPITEGTYIFKPNP